VRTIRIMASTHGGGAHRTHGSRAPSPRPTIERLEGRDLPSAGGLLPASPDALRGDNQGAALVVSLTATLQGSRITLADSAGSSLDEQARAAKPGNGNVEDPPPAVRNDSNTADESKLSHSQNVVPREFSDPPNLVTRRTDPGADVLVGDPSAIGQETVFGLSGGALSDPVNASSLVGWAPGAAMSVILSAEILSGSAVGSDGQAKASTADTMPSGSAGNVVPELEVPEAAPYLHASVVASDREPPARAWADLLEGALHADWEGVDAELRQFLAGLGRPADHSAGYGAGPMWPLSIVAATALLMARRGPYGHRRPFRRPVQASLWISARRPVPFGPWPLGPP
jgi:hypothetical protein